MIRPCDIYLQQLLSTITMRPALLCSFMLASMSPLAAAVLSIPLTYTACAAACAGTAAGWYSFCGATAAAAATLPVIGTAFTPACYSAGLAFNTPAGQKACQIVCNLLLP